MRRALSATSGIWIIFGIACLGFGLWLAVTPGVVSAQDDVPGVDVPEGVAGAEYVGSGECADCHRGIVREHSATPHGMALQDVEDDKDLILADFEQGADLRTVQFPGEDAPRPFTPDDIVYIVGAGKYVQRYLYEVERRVYAVLPAEWDVVNGVWRPYLLAETWLDPAYDFTTNCAGCHVTGLDIERGRWEDDGVMCETCHGPGSNHLEAEDDAGRNPSDEEILAIHNAIVMSPDAQVCAQCHSAGSEPAENRPYPLDYRPGGVLVHESVFALVSEDDPAAWYGSGHARQSNMQYNEWLTSAHSTSLDTLRESSAAQDACLTCHSGDVAFTDRILELYADEDLTGPPPDAITLDTAANAITCVVCHSPHEAADVDAHLVTDAYELCTSCHRNTELITPLHHPVVEMFEGQPVIDAVAGQPSAHFGAEDGPRCVTCHMTLASAGGILLPNHTWQPIMPGEADAPPDACSSCHTDLSSVDLLSLIEDTQADVRARLSIAFARVGTIPTPEAGSDAEALYNQVVTALTFVQGDGSMGVHNYAYVDALLDEAGVLLTELSVPGITFQPTEAPAPTATPSADRLAAVTIERTATTGFRPMTLIIIGTVVLILLAGTAIYTRQARRQSKETPR